MKKTIPLILALLFAGAGCAQDIPVQPPAACTLEAKQCPDGTYVGRTGPHCEFAACPPQHTFFLLRERTGSSGNCTSDVDCRPTQSCQALEGVGTVYPNNKPSTFRIIKGECKMKASGGCNQDADCLAGLVCHAGVCTSPRGPGCDGPGRVCPSGYRCIQACGPPVVRMGDPPPSYYCELNEVASKPRNCPICLASNTEISTPTGNVNVRDVKLGMRVWSLNKDGKRVASLVINTSRMPAPPTHRVVHLVLSDGREAWVSPNHPTANGLPVGDLRVGDRYDGARIRSAERVPYWDRATFDLLPASETGDYWANGILLHSTLAP